MRAGSLRHLVTIFDMNADLCACEIGKAWLSILAKESAEPPLPTGIRSLSKIDIRARYSAKLAQGRYLTHHGRLFQITSARDVTGTKAELRITADEFVGQAAQYLPQGGNPRACRVVLQHEAPWLDEMGAVTEYKTKGEVVIIETGRIQVGDQLSLPGVTYNVIAYADGSDDGVVRGLWLEAQ